VQFVQLRVHDGDDASCFNLNRAQKPRLLAVRPEQLQKRNAFSFIKQIKLKPQVNRWDLLTADYGKDVVPAIGDSATITWALGKSIGDEIQFVDEKGQKFNVLLVGMLKESILQGSLIISEDNFVKRFPSEQGYRMFLIDLAPGKTETVSEALSAGLRDFGLELSSTKQRLAAFSAVENTYLSIFLILGGLGLILGSIGLGLVVLRNVVDRRGELAMLWAVGFARDSLKQMVFYEHSGLMLCGLAIGLVTALIAVAPVLTSPGAEVPYLSLILTTAGIAISGLMWILVASVFALSGKMLDALRNE